MTRAQRLALERLNFARSRLTSMTAEQRRDVTADRLMSSFGITHPEAAGLLKQYERTI